MKGHKETLVSVGNVYSLIVMIILWVYLHGIFANMHSHQTVHIKLCGFCISIIPQ